MLPPQYLTPNLQLLQKMVEETAEGVLASWPSPKKEDYVVVGAYIQVCNYMELNLRRSIETFGRAGMLASKVQGKYQKLVAGELVPALKHMVEKMGPAVENIPVTLQNLKGVEDSRAFRNIFAHWAARRMPNDEGTVFLTKNNEDAK